MTELSSKAIDRRLQFLEERAAALKAGAFESQFPRTSQAALPGSLHIETLRESGPAIVDTDNTDAIRLYEAMGFTHRGAARFMAVRASTPMPSNSSSVKVGWTIGFGC